MLRAVVLIAALSWLVVACAARSEDEIRAEFRAFASAHNQCESTADCVLARSWCPLGCSVAVNVEYQELVERKAADLVSEYGSTGRACSYECAEVVAGCVEGRCQSVAP